MLNSEMSVARLRMVCTRAIDKAERRARPGHEDDSDELVTAAMALDTWYRDRRYLNGKGSPKPVRLLGRAPSIEALIRLQRRGGKATRVARRLKALHLVVPCGNSLYRPRSEAAVISRHDPLALQHAARALSTLLETVAHNMSACGVGSIIERTAEVPDLPNEHVEAFKRFSQIQGRLHLRTVNDWLESRRSRSLGRARSSVRAGVHVHAFVGRAPKR